MPLCFVTFCEHVTAEDIIDIMTWLHQRTWPDRTRLARRQDKTTRQDDKTRQDKTRQDKTRQDKTRRNRQTLDRQTETDVLTRQDMTDPTNTGQTDRDRRLDQTRHDWLTWPVSHHRGITQPMAVSRGCKWDRYREDRGRGEVSTYPSLCKY